MSFGQWHRAARAARTAGGSDALHAITVARDWKLGRLEALV